MFGFSVPIFFVTMREALEAAMVVSVLASFVHQSFPRGTFLYKRMFRLILTGTLLAVAISAVIGAAFLVVWFKYAKNLWKSAEQLWEGIEGLVAGVMLTILAFGFLQSEELTEKWHKKLRRQLTVAVVASAKTDRDAPVLSNSNTAGYTLFILPFVTVLREGLECLVFIGGIGISSDPGTIPLAAVVGLGCGALLGYLIFRLGNSLKARAFFLASTIFILILAVGLTTRSVGKIESYRFKQRIGGADLDLSESTVHDVNSTLWYLDCCNPEEEVRNNYGWQVFAAILGWSNQGTYLTVFLYAGYCLVIAAVLLGYKVLRVRRAAARRERRAMRAAAAKLQIAADSDAATAAQDEKNEKSELPGAAAAAAAADGDMAEGGPATEHATEQDEFLRATQ
ncbi:iron permease FTR1 family-domain-containing protein [Zopfochytrium polystomum]|nr:iron permease FTR1 family-domain-containing protein [Zopfochytrium polystomum]